MSIETIAQEYGSIDLLAAYIMRTSQVDEDVALDLAYKLDLELEAELETILDDAEEE